MASNTYTWTCPRCRFTATSSVPSTPDNCPRCNYPDAPTAPVGEDPNEDLEAEVGPEAALQPAAGEAERPTVVENERTTLEWVKTSPIDRGWLAECMREEVGAHLNKIAIDEMPSMDDPVLGDIIDATALDWVGAADAVVDRYEGPRPTLICGCPAGYHLKSMEAIAAAHPERMS